MIAPTSVASLVRSFHDPADAAALKSRDLILMLLECCAGPLSRSQFAPGHITCTGLVLAPADNRILLVHHRRLDRWLVPGGHVEPGDAAIWDTARREVIEETGVAPAPDPAPRLAGLDVHGIPAAKGEPYHLHHDLLFQFRATAAELRVSGESHAVAWCSPSEFERYAIPDNLRRAYRRIVA
jgi:8-oxo-dGTP pyrophosphatase MutT (NUDIX family)